jgi:hypothetical protein
MQLAFKVRGNQQQPNSFKSNVSREMDNQVNPGLLPFFFYVQDIRLRISLQEHNTIETLCLSISLTSPSLTSVSPLT